MKTKVYSRIITGLLIVLLVVFAILSRTARCPSCHRIIGRNSDCKYCQMQYSFYDNAKDKTREVVAKRMTPPSSDNAKEAEEIKLLAKEKALPKVENINGLVEKETKALEKTKVVGLARLSQWKGRIRGNGKAALGALLIIVGLILFYDYPIAGTMIILAGIVVVIAVSRNQKPKEITTDS